MVHGPVGGAEAYLTVLLDKFMASLESKVDRMGTHNNEAAEHKAIINIKDLGNDKAGFRQWYDKFVNAFAQVNREYRTALQVIVKGIEMEDRLPTGGIKEWDDWINRR